MQDIIVDVVAGIGDAGPSATLGAGQLIMKRMAASFLERARPHVRAANTEQGDAIDGRGQPIGGSLDTAHFAVGAQTAVFGQKSFGQFSKSRVKRSPVGRDLIGRCPQARIGQNLVAGRGQLWAHGGQVGGGQAMLWQKDSLRVVGNQWGWHHALQENIGEVGPDIS
jgi:hypothetical protein